MPEQNQSSDKPDKIALASYLASLIAIVNYLDDTGQEYHEQRLVVAEEWRRTIGNLNDTLSKEHNDGRA